MLGAAGAPGAITVAATATGYGYAIFGAGAGGVVMIGTTPGYVDAAKQFGTYAFDMGEDAFAFWERLGEGSNVLESFLQMANWLGNNFIQYGSRTYGYLSTEVSYLNGLGAPIANIPK